MHAQWSMLGACCWAGRHGMGDSRLPRIASSATPLPYSELVALQELLLGQDSVEGAHDIRHRPLTVLRWGMGVGVHA